MKPSVVAEPGDCLVEFRRHQHAVTDPLHMRGPLRQPHQLAGARQRLVARIELLAPGRDRRQRRNAVHHLDLVAVRLFQPHPLAAAGLVDIFHRRGAGRLGETREVVLARGVVGKPDDLRLALLGDVDVMGRIGAAHIERGRRALRAHQAEAREELLHHIEVGCAKPPIGNVGRFDPRHSHLLVLSWLPPDFVQFQEDRDRTISSSRFSSSAQVSGRR